MLAPVSPGVAAVFAPSPRTVALAPDPASIALHPAHTVVGGPPVGGFLGRETT